jgi:hypothetical protein
MLTGVPGASVATMRDIVPFRDVEGSAMIGHPSGWRAAARMKSVRPPEVLIICQSAASLFTCPSKSTSIAEFTATKR